MVWYYFISTYTDESDLPIQPPSLPAWITPTKELKHQSPQKSAHDEYFSTINYSLSAQKQRPKAVQDPFELYQGEYKKQIYNVQNIPKLKTQEVQYLFEHYYFTYQKLQSYIIYHTITVPNMKYNHCFRQKNITLKQIIVTIFCIHKSWYLYPICWANMCWYRCFICVIQPIVQTTGTTWNKIIQWWNKQNDGTWTQPTITKTQPNHTVQYLARRTCCDFIATQQCTVTLNAQQTTSTYSCKLCAQISCKLHFKQKYQNNNFICYICQQYT